MSPPPSPAGAMIGESAVEHRDSAVAPATLFENFAALADADGGVESLRGLVIELALRGRLTDQDHRDQPANALVAHAESALGKGRARRALSEPITTAEALPAGWVWCEPQDLGVVSPRNDVNDSTEVGFVPMAVVPTDYRRGVAAEVRRWGDIKKGYTHVADRDIVVAKITPCFQNGKSCVVDGLMNGVGAGTTELLVLRPVPCVVEPNYLLLFYKSPDFIRGGVARMTGTAGQQRVPLEYFAAAPLPLPPLAEQTRIVAKVDQLMAICDDLEARQAKKRDVSTRLTKSALGALTTAEGLDNFDLAWKRVVENFDVLVDRPEKVGELRSLISELAVRGCIGAARRLAPRMADAPFAIPHGWEWIRLGDMCERITKGSSPKWQGVSYLESAKGGVLFVTSENVGSGRMLLEKPKFVEARFNEIEPRSILRRGDLLMNIVGASIGRVAIFDRDDVANVNQAVCIIRLKNVDDVVDRAFMLLFLNSPTCISYMFDKQVDSARANLGMGNISRFLVPLPPIAEQQAIVARVEHLMTTCDALEGRLVRTEESASKLVDAVVQEVVA